MLLLGGTMLEAGDNPDPVHNVAPALRLKSIVRIDMQTGKLVRVVVPAPAPAAAGVPRAAPDPAIKALVEKTAADYNVSPMLVDSVIAVESDYNPGAVSIKGAEGIMQLMPETARRFGVKNSFDVKQNVEGGVRYLRFLQDTFRDDELAIAAYNAGEKAVTKYNGVPPYHETVEYVKKVGRRYEQAKKKAGQKNAVAARAPAIAASPPEERHPPLVSFYDEQGRLNIATR